MLKTSVIIVAIIATTLVGCTSDKNVTTPTTQTTNTVAEAKPASATQPPLSVDPISEDLASYTEKLKTIVPLESEAMEAYSSVTGANAKNNDELIQVMTNKVIPKYREFISKLEAIVPKTDELREIHKLYVKGSNEQFTAMSQMTNLVTISANIGQINQSLANGRADVSEFSVRISELIKAHPLPNK